MGLAIVSDAAGLRDTCYTRVFGGHLFVGGINNISVTGAEPVNYFARLGRLCTPDF